jgi:hypothetical protein
MTECHQTWRFSKIEKFHRWGSCTATVLEGSEVHHGHGGGVAEHACKAVHRAAQSRTAPDSSCAAPWQMLARPSIDDYRPICISACGWLPNLRMLCLL